MERSGAQRWTQRQRFFDQAHFQASVDALFSRKGREILGLNMIQNNVCSFAERLHT